MKKFITAIVAVCLWTSVAIACASLPLQQPVFDRNTWSVTYMGQVYNYYKFRTGIAGYKTIDEMVRLQKTTFMSISPSSDKIHMIEIISQKEKLDIVGYGFSIQGHEYAIEDSDCDGIMDEVKRYDSSVFPPDCFHPSNQFPMTMDELAEDLAELSKEIAPALKYLEESFSEKGD